MPRACPVERSRSELISSERETPRDKPVASGDLSFRFCLAANVKLYGTSPWHLEILVLDLLAANVKLHGTSPWHLEILVLDFA